MKTALAIDTQIKIAVMEVTPAWAAKVLEDAKLDESYKNRPLCQKKVDEYARDMVRGQWLPNHQGVAFDENGTLIDGQHRLWAAVLANVPVMMTVSRNWPKNYRAGGMVLNTMDSIDRNRPRTTAQQMYLHGQKNATSMAAALRAIAVMVIGNEKLSLSMAQHLALREIFGSSIEEMFALTSGSNQRTSHLMAPMALYHMVDPAKAKDFASGYFAMANLNENDSRLLLRKVLDRITTNSMTSKSDRFVLHMTTCQAIRIFDSGKAMKQIRPSQEAIDWLVGIQDADTIKKLRAVVAIRGVDLGQRKMELANA